MLRKLSFSIIFVLSLVTSACQAGTPTPIVIPTESSNNPPSSETNNVPAPTATEMENQQAVKIALLDRLDQPEVMDQLKWIKLAIADFKTKTNLNIELVEGDTGSSPETAQSAAEQISVAGDIYGVIGLSYSSDASAAGTVLQQFALPCISFASNASVYPDSNPTFFQFVPTGDIEGSETGKLVTNILNAKKAFVIYESGSGPYYQNLYSSFGDTLASNGATMIGREPITSDTKDFASVVGKIQSSGADVVFLGTGTVEQAGLLIQEIQKEGVNVPVVGYSYFASTSYSDIAEGNYVISPVPAVSDSSVIQNYTQTYGDSNISPMGPEAYTATEVMLEAVQRAVDSGDLTTRTVADEISKTQQADSILGLPIAFETDGRLMDAHFYLLKVENGNFITVTP